MRAVGEGMDRVTAGEMESMRLTNLSSLLLSNEMVCREEGRGIWRGGDLHVRASSSTVPITSYSHAMEQSAFFNHVFSPNFPPGIASID